MIDQTDTIISEALEAQPQPNATGAGVVTELQQLSAQTAPTVTDGEGTAPVRISRKGERWNPAVHSDPPSETARGTWRKRRGVDELTTQLEPATPELAAQRTCATIFGSAAPLLDQFLPLTPPVQWAPSDDERANIEEALGRFYAAHPEWMVDLPPGVSLVLAVGAYALPRVAATPWGLKLIQKMIGGEEQPAKRDTLKNEIA